VLLHRIVIAYVPADCYLPVMIGAIVYGTRVIAIGRSEESLGLKSHSNGLATSAVIGFTIYTISVLSSFHDYALMRNTIISPLKHILDDAGMNPIIITGVIPGTLEELSLKIIEGE